MNNKKGISTIVATVLIVLITVAAVTILWAGISPMLDISDKTSCVGVATKYEIDSSGEFSKVSDADTFQFRVKNLGDSEAANVRVTVNIDGSSFLLTTANSAAEGGKTSSPIQNGAKIITVDDATLTLTSTSTVTASVAPLLIIDGEEVTCTGNQEVELNNLIAP
jgi:hypothetical protein